MTSTPITRYFLVVLVSLLTLTLSTVRAGAQTAPSASYAFTVTTTADTHDAHPGDGVCADSNGKCSLRAAIEESDALPSGSSITITVPAGTYGLTLGTLGLRGRHTITINGAGRTSTIISGNKKFGIMSIAGGTSASLSQLTISGGEGGSGGGIYNAGTLSVISSTISGNTANGYYGGGIDNDFGGTLIVKNSTISGNTCVDYGNGGGIDNAGQLTVTHSIINGNSATTGSGGGISNGTLNHPSGTVTVISSTISDNSASGGGGIDNSNGGTVTVTHSTLSGNVSTGGSGGGILNGYTLIVKNSTISGNSSTGTGQFRRVGGGIYSTGVSATVDVTKSTFSSNSAGDGGGAIYNDEGKLTVSKSTFSSNSAGSGGGIDNYGGTENVSSSTFNNNSAGSGGGIDNEGGTMTVANSTLSGNTGGGISNGNYGNGGTMTMSSSTLSGNSGGDIYNDASSSVTLTGTIVANSPSGSNCAGIIMDGGYNLDSGTSCGFSLSSDLTNTDPLLGPLGHNGGPTKTMALLQGSKAIDWVALSSCPSADQRGHTRPDGSGETTCDIGAYESSY